VLIALPLSVSHAVDDPYLQMLDEEVTKVEGGLTDTGKEDATARPDRTRGVQDAQAVASRKSFEAMLRQQHVGTYSFYRRLPERSREEVYVDYGNGASVESLRDKVVDRYLHP
jgi:hypothetical protein